MPLPSKAPSVFVARSNGLATRGGMYICSDSIANDIAAPIDEG